MSILNDLFPIVIENIEVNFGVVRVDNNIVLSWQEVANAKSYVIMLSDFDTPLNVVGTSNLTSFTIKGLSHGIYTIKVMAQVQAPISANTTNYNFIYKTDGTVEPYTKPLPIPEEIPIPINLKGIAGTDMICITWDEVSDIDNYVVSYSLNEDMAESIELNSECNTLITTNMTPLTTYYYTVSCIKDTVRGLPSVIEQITTL